MPIPSFMETRRSASPSPFEAQLFPSEALNGGAFPQLASNGRISLPSVPEGLDVEHYIPLLHLYTSILEAERLMHPFRKSLSLRSKTTGTSLPLHAVTALDASPLTPNLYFKREDQTIIKAYKMRGAFCGMRRAMLSYGATQFIAVSTGNHAMGILKAAELLRPASVQIVVPNNTAALKLKNINSKVLAVRHRGVDASILYIGDTFDDARAWAIEQSLGGERYYLDPYSNPWVVSGQGTIGLELFRQLTPILAQNPAITEVVLISPIGGGGLLAGTATALAMASAWEARFQSVSLKFVGLRLHNMSTKYGDAVRVKTPAAGNQSIFDALNVIHAKMNDEQMAWGMKETLRHLGARVEGPSGAPLYMAMHHAEWSPSPTRLVICMVSGGNVSVFPH
jgi:threonine dehydratase